MSELAERLSNLQARSKLAGGYTDAQAKEYFCELLSQGVTPKKAAEETGHTQRWFRTRANPDAITYDEAFAIAYEQAMADHRRSAASDAQQALYDAAKSGNVRAIEKILAAYHEDFGFLRSQSAATAINVETLVQILPGVSTETLERMIAEAEAQKALPEGVSRVIDAE